MRNLLISIKLTLAFCVVLAVGYVLVLWGFALVATPNSGQAVLVQEGTKVVGAASVGQSFTSDKYFWGRPSAVDYNGAGSGGSNFGPSNPAYLAMVEQRIDTFLMKHPYLQRSQVPSEMVTASGSGLDPHISPEAAAVQVQRVAQARGIDKAKVMEVVIKMTYTPIVGTATINVLKLNVALDEAFNH